MRTFALVRLEDESGVSGTGHVAEGVEFTDGTVAMRWRSNLTSTAIYRSIDDVEAIHGHGGKTVVKFSDEPQQTFDWECCAHCGCPPEARVGHDDTCASGCNDPLDQPPIKVKMPPRVAF